MEHKVSLEGSFGIWKDGTHACMCIMLKQGHVCNTWNPNLMKEIFFIYLFFLNATPKCIKQIFFADIIHVKKIQTFPPKVLLLLDVVQLYLAPF